MKAHISQYSVSSQELNISAILIESWQSNISECQYGQNAARQTQRRAYGMFGWCSAHLIAEV